MSWHLRHAYSSIAVCGHSICLCKLLRAACGWGCQQGTTSMMPAVPLCVITVINAYTCAENTPDLTVTTLTAHTCLMQLCRQNQGAGAPPAPLVACCQPRQLRPCMQALVQRGTGCSPPHLRLQAGGSLADVAFQMVCKDIRTGYCAPCMQMVARAPCMRACACARTASHHPIVLWQMSMEVLPVAPCGGIACGPMWRPSTCIPFLSCTFNLHLSWTAEF